MAYSCMSAQNAARPAHGEQPACGPWTLMRLRPPPSVRISRAAAFPGTISVKLSTSCSAMYLLLTAVRSPPPLEAEVAPFSPSRLLKKGVYRLSWSAGATCISCARVAILVSWSTMAKPPSWGSMPVMRCSLSVQAAGPWRRRSVSRTDRSGGTRPLRRFHVRSHRASSAVSSWSQPSRVGIAAGSAGAARAPGCAGAMGCGDPVPSGAHRGATRASPAGKDLCWAARPVPGADGVRPHRRLRGRPPEAGGARRTGRAMGTSVPSLAGCWRPPPRHPPGLQRALRATPGVLALPRLCTTCPHTGGTSLVPWPLAPRGAAPTSGWRPLSLVRRAGWLVEPCVVPARGLGPPHRGLMSRVRA